MKFIPLSETRMTDLCKLWNKELGTSFPMRTEILRQNIFQDPNLLDEGSWLAVDEASESVAGFIVSKMWLHTASGLDFGRDGGWIHALLVDSDYRRKGIGGELLAKAESALRDRGVRRFTLGNDFHRRLFPGIPDDFTDAKRWFEGRGYTHLETVHDLLNRYEESAHVELPRFDGVTFRLAGRGDAENVMAFMKRCFPGRWEYQTNQYWERGGTGREFVILEKEGNVIGFCRINDSHSPILAQNVYWGPLFTGELGGIGPLGIDAQFRGQQYGLAVVQAGIHFLLQRGIRQIVIDCTPYVDFYGKHGYRVWKSYARYEKREDERNERRLQP